MQCTQCGSNAGKSKFSEFLGLTESERIERKMNPAKELCNSCMGHHQRPKKAASVQKVVAPQEVYRGLSAKEKRGQKHMNRRAIALQQHSQVASDVASFPLPRTDQLDNGTHNYPDVLPIGATFVPQGFAIGEHTQRIIRVPEAPVTLESRCTYHSKLAGTDVYHPWVNFSTDSLRPNKLQTWCRDGKNQSVKTARQNARSVAALEREAQIEEGRRLEEQQVEVAAELALVEEVMGETEAVAVTGVPFVPNDVRVILPEAMFDGVEDKDYLNIQTRQLGYAELQRTGLWLLTQAQYAQSANLESQKLALKLQEEKDARHKLYEEAKGLYSALDEAQSALRQAQGDTAALEALRIELQQTKEMLDITSATLSLTEAENAKLQEKLSFIKSL